jgi:hypothetical protein
MTMRRLFGISRRAQYALGLIGVLMMGVRRYPQRLGSGFDPSNHTQASGAFDVYKRKLLPYKNFSHSTVSYTQFSFLQRLLRWILHLALFVPTRMLRVLGAPGRLLRRRDASSGKPMGALAVLDRPYTRFRQPTVRSMGVHVQRRSNAPATASIHPQSLFPPMGSSVHDVRPFQAGLPVDLRSIKTQLAKSTRSIGSNERSHVSTQRRAWKRSIGTVIVLGMSILLSVGVLAYKSSTNWYKRIYADALSGQELLNLAQQALEEQDFERAKGHFLQAEQEFQGAQQSMDRIQKVTNFFFFGGKVAASKHILSAGEYLSRAGYQLVVAFEPMQDILKGKDSTLVTDQSSVEDYIYQVMIILSMSRPQLQNALTSLELASKDLAEVDLEKLEADQRSAIEGAVVKIEQLKELIAQGYDLAEVLPDLLGHDRPKTYLVLFQNNTELRPTGGFIGSFALLTIYQGKVSDLFFDNVYNLDGQLELRGLTQAAPCPLCRLSPNWAMRDANWFIDFPTSARKVAEFYSEIGSEELDGVIAIDPVFVKDFLQLTGPVYLSKWNETITAENLVELLQYKVDIEYKDSEDPKLIMVDLTKAVMDRLLRIERSEWKRSMDLIKSNLDRKHILVYPFDAPSVRFMAQMKWDGGIDQVDRDYLTVNNANISANKASQFLQQKYDLTTQIQIDGSVENTLHIDYQNTSTWDWPGDEITNYQRVCVPLGSELVDARPGESDQGGKKGITAVIEESGKTCFADEVSILPNQSVSVTYVYRLPFNIASNAGQAYSFLVQKQPGTDGISLKRTVLFDAVQWEALQGSANLELVDKGTIEGTWNLDTDISYQVVFKEREIL